MRRVSLRLGLYHGLLMGLALTLGAWGPDAVGLSGVRLRLFFPAMLLGSLTLLVVGGLGGWLAARFETALAGAVVWLAMACVATLTIGHLPYEGRGLVAWLADTRFWGLPIYLFDATARTRMLLAAFFIVLLLVMLGLLQSYRLEGVRGALNPGGQMSSRAALLLALPLPLAVGVGLAADSMVNRPLRVAPQLVNEAIRTGRTYPGSLSALSRERGVNYNAIAGVRDQMSANYALAIGEIDLGTAQTVIVVADFDNGAWINCRVLADQLSHCYDASPPYLRGFPAILTGEAIDDCPACALKVSGKQRVWLLARSQRFGGRPRVTRLAQWGSYVLMRAEAQDGSYAVECLFRGISPVRIERCVEGE